MPCLLSILDPEKGGEFSFRPAREDARVVSREYLAGTLVLRSTWEVGSSRVEVTEALAWPGPPRLLREARCVGPPVEMRSRFEPSFDAGRVHARLEVTGGVVIAAGAGQSVAVRSSAPWQETGGNAVVSRPSAAEGSPATLELMASAASGPATSGAGTDRLLAGTVDAWRSMSAGSPPPVVSPLAERVLGARPTRELLDLSGCVLIGLRRRDGGIVAAPTTSLPQWPGSARTWDYRFAWLRDSALAGLALARLGLIDHAQALGDFIGRVAGHIPPPALVRLDGDPAPPESRLEHLAGYGGARPVRIGNAAAAQPQLDVVGEVTELATCLEASGAMPATLRTALPRLADWTAERWRQPDHGIWEVRGEPRCYTHSRLMAWVALTGASALADRGAIEGKVLRWRDAAHRISSAILGAAGSGALQLHDRGGGADAALAQTPLVGFLAPGDVRVAATLDLILSQLATGGLIERYRGHSDALSDPCGPFVFPTFWLASALERCGRDGSELFRNAAASQGSTGLFGEVVDPATGTALGNYPQVQSHASFILAATVPP